MQKLAKCTKCNKLYPPGVTNVCPRCATVLCEASKPYCGFVRQKEPKPVIFEIGIGGDPRFSHNVYVPSTKRK